MLHIAIGRMVLSSPECDTAAVHFMALIIDITRLYNAMSNKRRLDETKQLGRSRARRDRLSQRSCLAFVVDWMSTLWFITKLPNWYAMSNTRRLDETKQLARRGGIVSATVVVSCFRCRLNEYIMIHNLLAKLTDWVSGVYICLCFFMWVDYASARMDSMEIAL